MLVGFPQHLEHRVSGGMGVGGLLFVNYIVDASIFDAAHRDPMGLVFFWEVGSVGGCVVCSLMIVLCCVAYKLLRAHGGCLGIKS